jgi:hypothetical protein
MAPSVGGSVRDPMSPLSCMRPSVTYTVPRFIVPPELFTNSKPNISPLLSKISTSRSIRESRGNSCFKQLLSVLHYVSQ